VGLIGIMKSSLHVFFTSITAKQITFYGVTNLALSKSQKEC